MSDRDLYERMLDYILADFQDAIVGEASALAQSFPERESRLTRKPLAEPFPWKIILPLFRVRRGDRVCLKD
jgi:hypothetical protein